jgi:acyl-CoA reductase-like NAD-dependent aldehyde dehydrogenase
MATDGRRARNTGPVHNPAAGAVLGELPHAPARDLDEALASWAGGETASCNAARR